MKRHSRRWRIRKRKSAILPFRNLGNDQASTFYEFSLADAVITELARCAHSLFALIGDLEVSGSTIDPREVGNELNVSACYRRIHTCRGEISCHRTIAGRRLGRNPLERSH